MTYLTQISCLVLVDLLNGNIYVFKSKKIFINRHKLWSFEQSKNKIKIQQTLIEKMQTKESNKSEILYKEKVNNSYGLI